MPSVKSPKAKQRRCLGWCGGFFWSSDPSNRRCPACQRKFHNMNPARTCSDVPVATREGSK